SHLYLSPILTASQGSTHGYDVTDATTVSAELGGPEGLARLSASAKVKESPRICSRYVESGRIGMRYAVLRSTSRDRAASVSF
ncbi:hypothetical protein BST36_30640, partial [Mycolicibacterium moriokaense]|uniref:alpha-amylase family glycosyl hydrolase n=1 Tax=Mycolicibacterium moriokaense TaxID=39691 RepID=UPI000A0B2163